jgi:8-oxo-dGTP pyrophosphatase MutT (NUDIX family)
MPAEPAFQVGDRVYYDARSRPVLYDGSAVTWRVGAYALALRAGRILMVRQGSGVHWELPGGAVEPTEPIAAAAAREVLEETGYSFVPDRGGPVHVDEMWFWKRGSASFHHSLLCVVRGCVEGEPEAGWRPYRRDEIGAVAWLDPRALREEETHPRHWAALRAVGVVGASKG